MIAFFLWYKRLESKLRAQELQEHEHVDDEEDPSTSRNLRHGAAGGFMRVPLESTQAKLAPLDLNMNAKANATTSSDKQSSSFHHHPHQTKPGIWDDPVILAMRIPVEDVVVDDLLLVAKSHSRGEIYRGTFQSQAVAIKMLSPPKTKRSNLQEIEAFFENAKCFAAFKHENILQVIGIAWDALSDVRVITEFMARGDLRTFLLAHSDAEDSGAPGVVGHGKVKIALHVAKALAYLHEMAPAPVVHRELTSKSVLLDENLDAKVGMFSVARPAAAMGVITPSLWTAPEVMTGSSFDERADMYSFGILLSELDSNALPFANMKHAETGTELSQMALLNLAALGKLAVAFSNETRQEIVQLGKKCTSLDPQERPSAADALCTLEHVLTSLCAAKESPRVSVRGSV